MYISIFQARQSRIWQEWIHSFSDQQQCWWQQCLFNKDTAYSKMQTIISTITMLIVTTITQDLDILVTARFTLQCLWRVNTCNYFGYYLLWGVTKFCNCLHHCCLHQPCWRFHNQWGVITCSKLRDFLFSLFHLHLI